MRTLVSFTIVLSIAAASVVAAAPAGPRALFQDVTRSAGISVTGDAHGIALNDYNGDGFIDIFVATKDAAHCALLRNRGDGTFANVTRSAGLVVAGGEPHAAAWGDFDRNGRLGLYVGNWRDSAPIPNTLFKQNPDGTFRNADAEAGLAGIAPTSSHSVTLGDFDGDGGLDIFAGAARTTALLLRNNRDGTFADVSARCGMQYSQRTHFVTTVDWDNDGKLDIFASSWAGDDAANRLYRNTGAGVFEDIAPQTVLADGDFHGGRFADFDNDGYLDLVAPDDGSDWPWGYFVGRRNRFESTAGRSGLYLGTERVHPLAVGDFDNDGLLDIFMGTMDGRSLLFRNLGHHRFRRMPADGGIPPLPGAKCAVFADCDNDGWLDLFTASSFQPCRFFRNLVGANHWLKVKLVGTHSNRDAIGARIYLSAGGRTQMREVCGGAGFQQDPFIQHFGLGRNAQADRIRIRWPSGAEQSVVAAPCNQTLTITEQ